MLDTYHAERYPVGRRVLRTSGIILRCALLRSRILRTARDAALRAASHLRPVARRMAGAVSGIDLAYPAAPGAHPLVGRRAPDIPLAGDTARTLYHALRPGHFLLVMPPNAAKLPAPTAGWEDRVDHAIARGAMHTAVLVRPDAYIACAGENSDGARQRDPRGAESVLRPCHQQTRTATSAPNDPIALTTAKAVASGTLAASARLVPTASAFVSAGDTGHATGLALGIEVRLWLMRKNVRCVRNPARIALGLAVR